METTLMVMSICSLIFSILAIGFSMFTVAKVAGFERSTHQVQFMNHPAEEPQLMGLKERQELQTEWNKDVDGWMQDLVK